MFDALDMLEFVNKFCYLGYMLGNGGGAEEVSRTRVWCDWDKFNELVSILTMKGASLRLSIISTRPEFRVFWCMVVRRGL